MARTCKHTFRPDCEGLEGRQLLSYTITNVYSGKALDDPGGSTANGTQIIQYQLNGGLNQKWELIQLYNGNYVIFNDASGKVLDDPGGSTANGTQIIQYQLHGGLNQQWKLVHLYGPVVGDTERYEIINVASGKALDDPGGSMANGTPIIQYQLHGGFNQQWRIHEEGTRIIQSPSAISTPSAAVSDVQWAQIGGPAGQVYAGAFGLVAVNPQTGDLYHYLGQPFKWARIGGPGRSFALGANKLFMLAPNGSGVYQYTGNGSNDQWIKIGGPAGQIYAGGGFGLVATNPQTGDLYHYLGQPFKWARIGGPGCAFAFGANNAVTGSNGPAVYLDRLFGLAPNGSGVYEYTGNGSNDQWIKIGGPAGQIYAGGFGLVATNPQTGDLYHYLGQPFKWARIGGPGGRSRSGPCLIACSGSPPMARGSTSTPGTEATTSGSRSGGRPTPLWRPFRMPTSMHCHPELITS